ncbi:MAG: AAA family ATPase [Defluviicoccus sp.]
MIICIFGPSYAGKTTLAQRAAAALDLPLRSCGNAVRQMAKNLGLPIDELPDDAHRVVDAASVDWAVEHQGGCMLEGRFLDAVFDAAGVSTNLIELRADINCRLKRARLRNGRSTFSADALNRVDAKDASFRGRQFGQHGIDLPRRVLDTSGRTVDECARQVQEIVTTWALSRENQHV